MEDITKKKQKIFLWTRYISFFIIFSKLSWNSSFFYMVVASPLYAYLKFFPTSQSHYYALFISLRLPYTTFFFIRYFPQHGFPSLGFFCISILRVDIVFLDAGKLFRLYSFVTLPLWMCRRKSVFKKKKSLKKDWAWREREAFWHRRH